LITASWTRNRTIVESKTIRLRARRMWAANERRPMPTSP
jgi:hypothetical protein